MNITYTYILLFFYLIVNNPSVLIETIAVTWGNLQIVHIKKTVVLFATVRQTMHKKNRHTAC